LHKLAAMSWTSLHCTAVMPCSALLCPVLPVCPDTQL
jgi:hypothetical protein